ncbi:hypothetical protein [Candidatus Viridilinea mediisalina]|nr:hypothetical protein [Candidatus Viridilinea mediisalina]
MSKRILLPCEQLEQLYSTEGWSMVEIAAQMGCCAATVSKRIHECGIKVRSGRFPSSKITPEILERLYSEEQLPIARIAAHLGVSIGTVHNRRRAYGLSPRRMRKAPISFTIRPKTKRIRESRNFFVWVSG